MSLQVASRKKVKIKMAISSPTGFGKSYSALLLGYGMTGDWSKIAVIDSENESANLYSDLGPYNVFDMKPDYTVDKFCNAVAECVKAGVEVIIVDSTYHYWHGKGGMLEYNSNLGGRYQDWAKTNKVYARWLDTILQTPVHFICTSRKKQAYEMTKVDGKVLVEKKGMEDEIRSGFDYEMTIAFDLINDRHLAASAKDRTRLFVDKPEFVITSETGKLIKQWCESGADAIPAINPISAAIAELYLCVNLDCLAETWKKYKQFQKDPGFAKAKDQHKAFLTMSNGELKHEADAADHDVRMKQG